MVGKATLGCHSASMLAAALAVAALVAAATRTRLRLARLRAVLRLIDEENAKDPREPPLELDYGRRMSDSTRFACNA